MSNRSDEVRPRIKTAISYHFPDPHQLNFLSPSTTGHHHQSSRPPPGGDLALPHPRLEHNRPLVEPALGQGLVPAQLIDQAATMGQGLDGLEREGLGALGDLAQGVRGQVGFAAQQRAPRRIAQEYARVVATGPRDDGAQPIVSGRGALVDCRGDDVHVRERKAVPFLGLAFGK